MPDTGNLTLATNGANLVQAGESNYLYCYAQDGLVEVELRKNREVVESHIVGLQTLVPEKDFDEFRIVNMSGSSNVVRFFFGKGKYSPAADRSVVLIDDAVPPTVALAPGSSLELTGSTITVTSDVAALFVALDDVTVSNSATLISAANSDRLEITISVKDTEANGIRIGGGGVTATKGIYVGPGQSYTAANRGALYGIRDGAADVAVNITESRKVS